MKLTHPARDDFELVSQPSRYHSLSILQKRMALLVVVALMAASVSAGPFVPLPRPVADSLPAAEFARIVRDLSEDGGYFRSDNFTSNETSYLHIVEKLRALGATGGAYVGVGPEQNFTYIAKVRPRIAFIIDIRRQAMIQHLMFKALFQLSSTRADYLSLMLSRPLKKDKPFAADAPIAEILTYLGQATSDDKTYDANLAAIRKTIRDDFKVQ